MAELEDARGLGPRGAILGGSTPLPPTRTADYADCWVESGVEFFNLRDLIACKPARNLRFCGSSSVVELFVANEKVAGSSPVSRSNFAATKGLEESPAPSKARKSPPKADVSRASGRLCPKGRRF